MNRRRTRRAYTHARTAPKLRGLARAATRSFPSADIDQMLAEVARESAGALHRSRHPQAP